MPIKHHAGCDTQIRNLEFRMIINHKLIIKYKSTKIFFQPNYPNAYYYLVHSYNMVDNVCWGSVILRLSNLDNVPRKFPIELIKVTISTRRCVSDLVSRMLLLQLFWLHVFQKMCFSFLINQMLQNSYIRKFPHENMFLILFSEWWNVEEK